MQFEVLTDEQIEAKKNERFKNLKEGIASFVVVSAKEDRSEAGNDMLTLDLECVDTDGTKGNVRTWLLLPHIIKHFCESVGSPEQYFTGKLTESFCQGKSGLCKLKMATRCLQVSQFSSTPSYVNIRTLSPFYKLLLCYPHCD